MMRMKSSTLCSPSSSEERRSFLASEDIPSITPKVKATEPKLLASPITRCRWYSVALFKTFQGFCQCGRRALQMDSYEVQPYLGSRLDLLFATRVIAINSFISCFFQGPKHFGLLCFHWCICKTWSPILIPPLENGLADGVPVLVHERWPPSSCARKASSSAPSRITAPRKSVANFSFSTFSDFVSFSRSFVCFQVLVDAGDDATSEKEISHVLVGLLLRRDVKTILRHLSLAC